MVAGHIETRSVDAQRRILVGVPGKGRDSKSAKQKVYLANRTHYRLIVFQEIEPSEIGLTGIDAIHSAI